MMKDISDVGHEMEMKIKDFQKQFKLKASNLQIDVVQVQNV